MRTVFGITINHIKKSVNVKFFTLICYLLSIVAKNMDGTKTVVHMWC